MPDYTIWIFNASKYILNIEAQMHVPSRHINSFHTESSAQPSIGQANTNPYSCFYETPFRDSPDAWWPSVVSYCSHRRLRIDLTHMSSASINDERHNLFYDISNLRSLAKSLLLSTGIHCIWIKSPSIFAKLESSRIPVCVSASHR